MPVPTTIDDLDPDEANNFPIGSDNVFPELDNYLRAHAAFIAELRDRDSAFALTLLDDTTAAEARTTLGAMGIAELQLRGVHVEDEAYGAVGDGSTNDQAAIQAAIDAAEDAGGGWVLFENKTYVINSRIFWRSGVILVGKGDTIIKVADGVDSPVIGISSQDTTPALTNIGAIGIAFDGNGSNGPGATAYSCALLDPVDGGYFERCEFRNARGYGASLQYTSSAIPDNTRCKNITFVRCDFHGNGAGTATPGTTFDGIDVKNCDGLTCIRCRAYNNTLDGFDFRGDNVELIACESYDNGGSGLEISANTNGTTQNTSVRVVGGHYYENARGVSISNDPAGGSGLTRVSITGALIRANTGDGVEFGANNTNTYATINAHIFANGDDGVNIPAAAKQVILQSCQIVNNTGDGVSCNAADTLQINGGLIQGNGGWGYLEGASATRNLLAGPLRILSNTSGQISLNSASRLTKVAPEVLDYTPNSTDIIASAATITLPSGGSYFAVTGTTNITSITASWRGRVVTLQFSGVLTVTDGSNLALSANFTTSSADTLTLACDGSSWIEVARSVN